MKGLKSDTDKLPMGVIIQKQFPLALKAICECSVYGHNKYLKEDSDWLNFKRIENPFERYSDALQRHFIEEGKENKVKDEESELYHIYHTAWNALSRLEIFLEELNK